MNPVATPLSDDESSRLEAALPWYVNGTSTPEERAWVEALLARSPAAADLLARERALLDAAPLLVSPIARDAGLDRLMARVRAEAGDETRDKGRAPRRDTAGAMSPAAWMARLRRGLASPRLGMALAVLVVAQAGVIGVLSRQRGETGASEFRSAGVTEVRTLRVTFARTASEPEIRAALLKAGARLVGGPTQLGEYWIASGMRSMDEVSASLHESGLVASMDIDPAGPRGQ